MHMAGLEHVSCLMPAILCVYQRLPVAPGPAPAGGGGAAPRSTAVEGHSQAQLELGSAGSRSSGRYIRVTVKRQNLGHLGLDPLGG